MTELVAARGLSAGYKGVAAIRGLDLEVSAGEVVGLLGPNGAGKTTTIRALSGLLQPISGDVQFLGQSSRSPLHRRVRRGLGLVTEERSVLMRLTVMQNLAIGRGDPHKALALFPELEPLVDRKVGLLSGGEQQMLTLGRALSHSGCKILLVDELSLGLAPLLVERLFTEVRRAADRGMGVLLVEQQVHRALAIVDRVCILANGRSVYSGSGEQAHREIDDIRSHYLGYGPVV